MRLDTIILDDGFGYIREFPEKSEFEIHHSYILNSERHIVVRYLNAPFCFRKILQTNISSLEPTLSEFLLKNQTNIELGLYDRPQFM